MKLTARTQEAARKTAIWLLGAGVLLIWACMFQPDPPRWLAAVGCGVGSAGMFAAAVACYPRPRG